MATRIQLRRGVAADWVDTNPILADGEPGIETDTGVLKIGNGVTAWNSLPKLFDNVYSTIPGTEDLIADAIAAEVSRANAAYTTPASMASALASYTTTAALTTAINAEISRADAAYAPIGSVGGGSTYVYNVKDHGAVGDGVTDDSAAFASALAAAKASTHTLPYSLASDPQAKVLIEIPAGDYLITSNKGMLGVENMTSKLVGLHFRGAGRGITNIIFKPATAGALCYIDYWLEVSWSEMSFYAATTGCTFLQSYTTHNAQSFSFRNLAFKKFKYVVDLQGNNNNSEFMFLNCRGSNIEDDGAFFYIGASNTSDQFLNYWFYGCTHWSSNAPFLDVAKGGSFHIFGFDASDWGPGLTSQKYLFYLRGTAHAYGVCNFYAEGVRVEAKNAYCGLIFSEWPMGNVTFQNADFWSQTSGYTYNDVISLKYSNYGGAIYTFRDSMLLGGVKVAFNTNDFSSLKKISFERCTWLQKNSPSDVVTYDTSGASPNVHTVPPVEFIDCRGPSATGNAVGTDGAAVWDATIGFRGQAMQSLKERRVSLRGLYGVPNTTSTLKALLPVGAIITGFEVLAVAGSSSTEGDGGTWTLATSETTPTTIATATVATAINAGFDVKTDLSVPFYCNNTDKARIVVTATNVSQNIREALLIVKGYW